MFTKFLAAAVALLLGSCGVADETSAGSNGLPTGSPATTTTVQTGTSTSERFAGLTIELELEATTVRSGAEVASTLTVSNRSGEDITDPRCLIATGRYALVPVDDSDAELWLQPVADCAGPFTMRDGFEKTYPGPRFPARTKQGDALSPGAYVAALEIEGYPKRLEQPVEVTP